MEPFSKLLLLFQSLALRFVLLFSGHYQNYIRHFHQQNYLNQSFQQKESDHLRRS